MVSGDLLLEARRRAGISQVELGRLSGVAPSLIGRYERYEVIPSFERVRDLVRACGLEECFHLAQQAPTAGYSQSWHFVVVTDPDKRAALGEMWRQVAYPYLERGGGPREGQMARIGAAVVHLAEHIHEVPVHVIPCV